LPAQKIPDETPYSNPKYTAFPEKKGEIKRLDITAALRKVPIEYRNLALTYAIKYVPTRKNNV
jgi:hypothetical protein